MWCWAAVGVSVDHYFRRNSTLRICELAGQILHTAGTCDKQPSGLGETAHLEDVLRHLQLLNEPPRAGVILCFDQIRTQINASLPVCVRIGWPDQVSGHFVIICGFAVSASGEQWVDVADPAFDDSIMLYDDFVNIYQGVGQWTDTFLVQTSPNGAN